jgi:SSS family solute:Na+ symporter
MMIVVGIYASRKSLSMTQFVVAGRGLPVWLCSTTIVATWYGGGTLLGSAGAAYDRGFLGVIYDPFGASLSLLLLGFFFVRLFRRLRILTVADFMEQRYGRFAGVAITVAVLFSNIAWVGSMLVAFSIIFETMTGTPMILGIIGGAAVIFLYTAIGGMWAVVLTDFIQMIIIAVGVVVLFIAVLIDVGGPGAVLPRLDSDTFRLIPLESTPEVWLDYARAWVIIGLADLSSQSLIQRALAAKSERVAQNSFYAAAIAYFFFAMMPVLLGIIAGVTLPSLAESEAVIPTLAIEHLHPVIVAIFVGAMLSAIMSSADSALLAMSSMIANNLLPIIRPTATDELQLLVARLSIPACGTLAIFVALEIQTVYSLIVDANILLLATIIVPFIAGVWWRRANRTGAYAAMAAGFVTWILTMRLLPNMPADFFGLGACLVTLLIVTPLTQSFDPPRQLHDSDGNPVDLTDRLGVLPVFSRASSTDDV